MLRDFFSHSFAVSSFSYIFLLLFSFVRSSLYFVSFRAGFRGDRAERPQRAPKFGGGGPPETKVKSDFFLFANIVLKINVFDKRLISPALLLFTRTPLYLVT